MGRSSRTPQRQKALDKVRQVQDLRRSSAASPIPSRIFEPTVSDWDDEDDDFDLFSFLGDEDGP